jgi:hypothetical protein
MTFYLHKFPLISKSHYFDESIPDSAAVPAGGVLEMELADFPGGPRAFETVAKFMYGIDIEVTTEDIAFIYCACRYLRIPDLEKTTEAFMTEVVLQDPRKSAKVLKVATGIENMTEAMMEGLVGHCINAIAARFAPLPELNELPPDCFACIVRNARDMDVVKVTLEAAVLQYLESKISDDVVALSVDEFIEVVQSPGRMEDMRHCEGVYVFLETMIRKFPDDATIEQLCKALHDLGFWVCLPHVVIEKAYADRNIPDRYCAVALMAENRHLLKVNESLTEQVEQLTEQLASAGLPHDVYRSVPAPGAAAGGGSAHY